MNKGSGLYIGLTKRERFISNEIGNDSHAVDPRFSISSIYVDLDFRVLVEIMRFVYTGKVEIDQHNNDSPGIATSLLVASDHYYLHPLDSQCIEWLRLHASVEVFYALDSSLNARYIQNVAKYQEALSLLCDIFSHFADQIIACKGFPYVSFASLKEIIRRFYSTEHDEIRKLIYRWNAYDDHPVHEVEYLESIAGPLTNLPEISEFSSQISADFQSFRLIIHCPKPSWNIKVGVAPGYLFDVAPTIHTFISRIRHPESSEESFVTSMSRDRVEFCLEISREANHLYINIFTGSTLISSLACEGVEPVIFFAKSSMATFTVIPL